MIGITNVGGSVQSHETRHQKNAEIYDQAYPIGFKKNIENRCKGVRKYKKMVIRCKAD